jgi:hypothetical protein
MLSRPRGRAAIVNTRAACEPHANAPRRKCRAKRFSAPKGKPGVRRHRRHEHAEAEPTQASRERNRIKRLERRKKDP